MAKRRVVKPMSSDSLADLSALAGKLDVPDGFLDDELEDACDMDARMAFEAVRDAVVLEQLEFLYMRGYTLGRLKELIKEAVAEARGKEDQP